MKYLKPFNESITQDNIELCCVDLFDDGFELRGYNETGKTIIQLVKDITSSLSDDQYIAVFDEHSKNYRQGTITISGRNFDHVITSERPKDLPFTDKENKLISQVSDAANLLSHYSSTKCSGDRVVITIVNRGLQNPYNFQYERYITQINILFYL
jgi:hypothetical protein